MKTMAHSRGLRNTTNARRQRIIEFAACLGLGAMGMLAVVLFDTPPTGAIPQETTASSDNRNILRIAGLKERGLQGQQCYVMQSFGDRLQSAIQKIERLTTDHPKTDLLVLPEDLFDAFSGGRTVLINCPDDATDCSFASDGTPGGNELFGYLEQFRVLAERHKLNMSFVVSELWHPDPVEYPNMSDPTVFETSVVMNHIGAITMKKRRTQFCGFTNLPPASEEHCRATLNTVNYTRLLTHTGEDFTMVPVICANRFEPTWLNEADGFDVDVVANSSQENSPTRFDHVSEYLATGSVQESNSALGCYIDKEWQPLMMSRNAIETDNAKNGYYPGFLEEYAVKRDVMDEEGVLVHADGMDEQAGFYLLNRRNVLAWDLGKQDYVYGEVLLPRPSRQSSLSQGLGSRNTVAITDIVSYNNKLYFGTYGLDGLTVWEMDQNRRTRRLSTTGFGNRRNYAAVDLTVFQNRLYVATQFTRRDDNFESPNQSGGEIWRYDFVGNSWERVATDGITDRDNQAITSFAVFQNTLFAGSFNHLTGAMVHKSTTGTDWTRAFSTMPWQPLSAYRVQDLVSYQDRLFAGLSGEGEVWSTVSVSGPWTQANTDGFDDTNNEGVTKFIVFNNALYAATANYETGAELWRTTNGTAWTRVNTDGFGDPGNGRIWDLAIWNGKLVAGTQNHRGGQVWMSSNGMTWTRPAITSQRYGFGNTQNQYINAFEPLGEYLYAGTYNGDGAELWRTTDGVRWTIVTPVIFDHSSE